MLPDITCTESTNPPALKIYYFLQSVPPISMEGYPSTRDALESSRHPVPQAVNITTLGFDKTEGEEVIMPILDAVPVASPSLLYIVTCSCNAALQSCTTAKCSCRPVPATTSLKIMIVHVASRSQTHSKKSKTRRMQGLEKKMKTEQMRRRMMLMMSIWFITVQSSRGASALAWWKFSSCIVLSN